MKIDNRKNKVYDDFKLASTIKVEVIGKQIKQVTSFKYICILITDLILGSQDWVLKLVHLSGYLTNRLSVVWTNK